MRDLRIGTRLSLGFGVIVALLVVIAVVGVSRLTVLAEGTHLVVSDKYPQVVLCNTVIHEANNVAQAVRNALLFNDPTKIKQELAKVKESRGNIEQALPRLGKLVQSEHGHELFNRVVAQNGTYVAALTRLSSLIDDGKREGAIDFLLKEMYPVQQAYFDSLDKLIAYQTDVMDQAGKEADTQYQAWRITSLMLSILGILAAALIGFFTTRSITRPISQAMEIARTVATGDLTSDIVVKSHDETGQLLQAMKDMNEGLLRIIGSLVYI